MEIIEGFPPNIEEIREAFNPPPYAVFTYAPKIYNPTEALLPPHLIAHEKVHLEQQGDNPKKWWKRFIADPEFRMQEELEAYRVQYQYFCRNIPNRMKRYDFLRELGLLISGPMYGNQISLQDAMLKIRA